MKKICLKQEVELFLIKFNHTGDFKYLKLICQQRLCRYASQNTLLGSTGVLDMIHDRLAASKYINDDIAMKIYKKCDGATVRILTTNLILSPKIMDTIVLKYITQITSIEFMLKYLKQENISPTLKQLISKRINELQRTEMEIPF